MDRREQIAHLAATREEEMLLVRVCEKLDTAVQRDIPTATNFLSKREQMLVCEVLRGAPIRFFGGLSTADWEDLAFSAGAGAQEVRELEPCFTTY